MLRLVSLLSVLAIGCVDLPELTDDQLGSSEQAIIECETWICGSNSPILGGLRFHELNTRGLPNLEGFSVISLWQAGINYQLSVERGRIIGRAGVGEIWGPALVGAQIRVREGIKTYGIRITAVGSVQTFAKLLGAPRTLETYQLDAAELVGDAPPTGWRNLCSNIPARDNPDVLGMNTFHALVFEGERVDRHSKTIGAALDATWFNIGCAGHALAKMAINAQTEAARQAFGFNTTILERQTFLKMLTADYCGTGRTFTVSGQPLQWADWRGYTNYVANPANLALEVRWNPNGATCLNTPRVTANPSALGAAIFGNANDLLAAIELECGGNLPPQCAGAVDFFDGKMLLSANPL